MMNRWIILAGIGCWLAASWGFAADVLIDDFNGSYIYDGDWIEEDWTPRAFWNGSWHHEQVNVFSPPSAQKFFTATGDTCRFCISAIVHGGSGSTFSLRAFASDIDATKPWSLTCNVWGHNDTKRPDYFIQYWTSSFDIAEFSNASEEYGPVHWTSQNDSADPAKIQLWERWQQMTFRTNGSTSGDEVIELYLIPSWGRSVPINDQSIMNFDDLWLTYTPDNGDGTPPGDVIGLAATRDAENYEMELTWQNPSDVDFAGTVIRMRNDHPPVTKWDGELVVDLPGSPGALESFVHFPVAPQKTYYYAAFAYDDRTTGPNGDVADYANYSAGVTVEDPGEPTPTVDADIGLIEALGWTVINHGDAASPNFDDYDPPTAWDTTTATPSGDNKSAEIRTSGTQRARWQEANGFGDIPEQEDVAVTIFMVWKAGQGMRLSDPNPIADGGVWRTSTTNVLEIRTEGALLRINADAYHAWPWDGNCEEPILVPDGLTDLGFCDKGDPERPQFDCFTVETDKWHRWWFQMDQDRNFELYDLNDVVPGEGPHLLISDYLNYDHASIRISIGDAATSVDKNSDMMVDEVYVLNGFRDVSEVPWSPSYPDYNGDGRVNEDDLNIFQDCATGPGIPYDPDSLPDPEGCNLVPDADDIIHPDFDRDRDVDQDDFGRFQRCISGNDPADPACMEW